MMLSASFEHASFRDLLQQHKQCGEPNFIELLQSFFDVAGKSNKDTSGNIFLRKIIVL